MTTSGTATTMRSPFSTTQTESEPIAVPYPKIEAEFLLLEDLTDIRDGLLTAKTYGSHGVEHFIPYAEYRRRQR